MLKRFFDFFFAVASILLVFPILICCWVLASLETHTNGLFLQTRIGQNGKPFTIFKYSTMPVGKNTISNIGAFLRKFKLDELPQLLNVIIGNMSIVGPRPDIAGYYDTLQGKERNILKLKPGLTSEAALKYWNEETLLKQQQNPLKFNDEVIFPDKVKLNLEYYYKQSFWGDLKIIWRTLVTLFK